jgi:hypothetical protein
VEAGDAAFALGRGKSVDEEVVDAVLEIDPLTNKEMKLFRVAPSPPNWSDGGPVLDRKGCVIGLATTGPAGLDYQLLSATARASSRGKNKWKYQEKMVIPVAALAEAGTFTGIEYRMLPRNEAWKSFRETQTGYGTAYIFTDPRNVEKLSYEQTSVSDRGNGRKRVWVKRYSDVVLKTLENDPELQRMYGGPKDRSETSLFLFDVDCTTHQKRFNIRFNTTRSMDRIDYNFNKNNRWMAMEPELDKEICPR